MNGHIGFNEPGSLIGNKVQIVALDRVTQTVGQKYFDKPMLLKKGITIALRSFLDAKKALLIANGAQKASIIQQTIEGEVNITIPSTIIQLHKNASVMIDDEAAACLIN
ncbi:Glucosamine-6-phosphate deaminase 1 [compost metagenome]